ncbi:hypothetical protein V8F06_014888, partial [Rhypophila decipiens]
KQGGGTHQGGGRGDGGGRDGGRGRGNDSSYGGGRGQNNDGYGRGGYGNGGYGLNNDGYYGGGRGQGSLGGGYGESYGGGGYGTQFRRGGRGDGYGLGQRGGRQDLRAGHVGDTNSNFHGGNQYSQYGSQGFSDHTPNSFHQQESGRITGEFDERDDYHSFNGDSLSGNAQLPRKAFIDDNFVKRMNIPIFPLAVRKPLFLADGLFSKWVTHYAELGLRTGHHREVIQLFVTELAQEHPIVLGTPWLEEHNPDINWVTFELAFRETCEGLCFPRGLPYRLRLAPKATPQRQHLIEATLSGSKPVKSRATTVEEVPDEGEPWQRTKDIDGLKRLQRERQTRQRRERRQRERMRLVKERATTSGPRWTMAPPESRAYVIPNQPDTVRMPAQRRGGSRATDPVKRVLRWQEPDAEDLGEINPNDIKILNGPSFMMVAKQKGVQLCRVTMDQLEKAAQRKGSPELPRLPEKLFRQLLEGRGDRRQFKQVFPEDFHDFIDLCYDDQTTLARIAEGNARTCEYCDDRVVFGKITTEDAEKFFEKADKGYTSEKKILELVPKS